MPEALGGNGSGFYIEEGSPIKFHGGWQVIRALRPTMDPETHSRLLYQIGRQAPLLNNRFERWSVDSFALTALLDPAPNDIQCNCARVFSDAKPISSHTVIHFLFEFLKSSVTEAES